MLRRSNRIALVVISIALCACLSACATRIKIYTDYDPALNFGELSTYRWLDSTTHEDPDPRVANSLLEQRVEDAVESVLAARGFRRVDDDPVDFYLIYHATLDQKLTVMTTDSYHMPGWGYGWGGTMGSQTYVSNIDEGTLIIDVLDPDTRDIMWRGMAMAEMFQEKTPEERVADVQEAVRRMLANFPPKSSEN
jgi:hypothetical protein